MGRGIFRGSVLALAVLATGSTQATACDDCDYCGGYAYYGASYGYYASPAYAYAPGPYYYAAPAYAYNAPLYAPAYYAPAPAYYAPSGYGYYPYARPYYDWRAGYVDAGTVARRNGVVPGAAPPARGIYALGVGPGPRTVKAPSQGHIVPPIVKMAKPIRAAPGIVATAPKAPKPGSSPRAFPAALAKHGKPEAKFPVAGYGPQPKYIPTASYSAPGGYAGPLR
jgi:hypothetical protein